MLPRLLVAAVTVALAGPAAADGMARRADSGAGGEWRGEVPAWGGGGEAPEGGLSPREAPALRGLFGIPPLAPPEILLAPLDEPLRREGSAARGGEPGSAPAGGDDPPAGEEGPGEDGVDPSGDTGASRGGNGAAGRDAPPEGAESPGEDDFDLFGDTAAREAELAAPELEREIQRRRSLLRTHQVLGLTTLGLMTATAIVGQVNYAHTYGRDADGSDGLRVPHMVLSYTTAAAFAATAGFSLLAPDPVERKSRGLDTVTLHKIAVIGASAGMLAQAGLGFSAARSADAGHPTRPGDLAAVHQVIGWTTLGFMAAAATVWLF